MKKIISIILMLFITLSLSSCDLFDWIAGKEDVEIIQLDRPLNIKIDNDVLKWC